MPDTLIRPNATHVLAVVNPAGIPEVGDLSNPSAHLSLDADGNLRTSAVAVIGGSVEISNDVGNPVPITGAVTATPTEATTVPTQITKTVAATNTPEALAADGTLFKTALLIANKAARTANTGKVWLGVSAGDGTQPIGLDSGDTWEVNAPEGQKYDLNDWYLDVETAADGVVVIYS